MKLRSAALILIVSFFPEPSRCIAAPNYHVVGWFNTFVPGGGEMLLGHPFYGAFQAGAEISTFMIGYNRSGRSPMTIDGVPESLPQPAAAGTVVLTSTKYKCIVWNNVTHKCTSWKKITTSTTSAVDDNTPQDLSTALYDDWLQEFGLKYHFVNVFNAYRAAAKGGGVIDNQKIDQSSTAALFLAPFSPKNIFDPVFGIAIVASAAAMIYSYNDLIKTGGIAPVAPFTQKTKDLYNATYLGVYPVGSAAPEEMFYRGFLQHEFYAMTRTPFLSVPLSTAAYAFSHSPDERASAAVSGLFLGILTHADRGSLSRAITYHFWANVLAGLYQISVVRKGQGGVPLVDLSFHF
jgi:membrane protease YdiL (CAAX protease family)